MRAPLSWIREMVDLPDDCSGRDLADRLIAAGLEVETVEQVGAGLSGPLVVGRVRSIEELTEFKKPIRWCTLDLGDQGERGIVCGASNFAVGDLVVVATPGTVLPGGFAISARSTYGKVSDGMICSERELGLGADHAGIIVLPEGSAQPGDDAIALLGIGDEILDIAITPDRGYALSIRGIAREAAIAYGLDFADPGERLADLPPPPAGAVPAECASTDPTGCDLITVRTIEGFDPGAPSPLWMRRRLIACGMRPVSLAVDVTNYVMLELGQPLHAFDLDKLQGTVRAARATEGTAFETLDHVVRTLSNEDLVIADDRGPIGLAGVMGGLETEIDAGTTRIALEAAHFSAEAIARASRRHRISSEASRRFERGVDPDLAPYASARAAALLLEFGGGRHCGMTGVDAGRPAITIPLPSGEPGSVAGFEIPAERVRWALEAVGCTIEGDDLLRVSPPSWRPDLRDPIDLVEEVLRLVGYDCIPATLPPAPLGRGLTAAQRLRRRVGTVLAARGLIEVLTYPFVAQHPASPGSPRLANPISEEAPHLRPSMLPGLMAAAARNLARGSTDLAMFEIGAVFLDEVRPESSVRQPVDRRPLPAEWEGIVAALPRQPMHLGVFLAGDRERQGWWGPARATTWADALEAALVAADSCGVALAVEAGGDPWFHPGRSASLRLPGGPVIGCAGELHPRVLEGFGMPARSAAAWLDLDALTAAAPGMRPAPVIATPPVAKEDLALVVDRTVSAEAVREALAAGAGDLLESVRLFDVYEGPQVREGGKSLAFALRFRAEDRTLEAAEIAAARAGAVAEAARRCGAVLRA